MGKKVRTLAVYKRLIKGNEGYVLRDPDMQGGEQVVQLSASIGFSGNECSELLLKDEPGEKLLIVAEFFCLIKIFDNSHGRFGKPACFKL